MCSFILYLQPRLEIGIGDFICIGKLKLQSVKLPGAGVGVGVDAEEAKGELKLRWE